MIILSYSQWHICQTKPLALDHSGVGLKHCSYYTNGIEVFILFTGNVLLIASWILEKLRSKKSI